MDKAVLRKRNTQLSVVQLKINIFQYKKRIKLICNTEFSKLDGQALGTDISPCMAYLKYYILQTVQK